MPASETIIPENRDGSKAAAHGSAYATLTPENLARLQGIYEHFAAKPSVIRAHTLDFISLKDGVERRFEADSIKDVLRFMPALIEAARAAIQRAEGAGQ